MKNRGELNIYMHISKYEENNYQTFRRHVLKKSYTKKSFDI